MPTLIGFRNYCKTGAISSNSQTPQLPASNLAGDICAPSTGWQTRTGDVTSPATLLRINSPTSGAVFRVFGLFRTNLTSSASINIVVWQNVSGGSPVSVYGTTISGPAVGYGQVVAVAPSDVVGDFVQFTINDATNPDGFINVGGCYVGPAWIPASGVTWATTTGRKDVRQQTVSRGGQVYNVLQWQARTWDIGFDAVRQSELWTQLDALRITARTGVNVLFIPNYASSDMKYEALFGMLEDSADVSFSGKSADMRAWRAVITERL